MRCNGVRVGVGEKRVVSKHPFIAYYPPSKAIQSIASFNRDKLRLDDNRRGVFCIASFQDRVRHVDVLQDRRRPILGVGSSLHF